MDIFESLENLNISEECFNEILILVEEYINEVSLNKWAEAAKSSLPKREECTKEKINTNDSTLNTLVTFSKALRASHAKNVSDIYDSINRNKSSRLRGVKFYGKENVKDKSTPSDSTKRISANGVAKRIRTIDPVVSRVKEL